MICPGVVLRLAASETDGMIVYQITLLLIGETARWLIIVDRFTGGPVTRSWPAPACHGINYLSQRLAGCRLLLSAFDDMPARSARPIIKIVVGNIRDGSEYPSPKRSARYSYSELLAA